MPTMPRTGQKLVVLPVGWVAGWVAGSNGNNANSASVEVEVEAELDNKDVEGSAISPSQKLYI